VTGPGSHAAAGTEKPREEGVVRLAALGDLMLNGEWEGVSPAEAYGSLRSALNGAAVFANLETSILGTDGAIEKEPRVFASEKTIQEALRALEVRVVNLANNHSFDGNLDGYRRMVSLLERQGVSHFGAGADAAEAARPLVQEIGTLHIGWLGYVSAGSEPPHAASPTAYGANLLEASRCRKEIADLKTRADHVVVSLHWGAEFCHLPSPDQIEAARSFIDAGATLVLGHHAHAIQGIERHGGGLIAYNLGNATTTDHRIGRRLAIRQTRRTRSSVALRVDLSRTALLGYEAIPIRSLRGTILVHDDFAAACVRKANGYLNRGVTPRVWKRRRILEDVVFRTAAKLHPAVIRSVGPRHFAKLFRNLFSAAGGRSRT
jgi:capsule synthesis protein PGA_cap